MRLSSNSRYLCVFVCLLLMTSWLSAEDLALSLQRAPGEVAGAATTRPTADTEVIRVRVRDREAFGLNLETKSHVRKLSGRVDRAGQGATYRVRVQLEWRDGTQGVDANKANPNAISTSALVKLDEECSLAASQDEKWVLRITPWVEP